MFSCWHCEPDKRPTFTEISEKIDWFIERPELNGIHPLIDIKRSEW